MRESKRLSACVYILYESERARRSGFRDRIFFSGLASEYVYIRIRKGDTRRGDAESTSPSACESTLRRFLFFTAAYFRASVCARALYTPFISLAETFGGYIFSFFHIESAEFGERPESGVE